MIAKLKGILDSAGPDWLVIDVAGVGYLVFASGRTLSGLPAIGETLSLIIETHVREDRIHLYGFATTVERDMYRLLTTVSGIGAKVALAILSAHDPQSLANAIVAGDKAAVARAQGVGPRLAQRVVTELKDKVTGFAMVTTGPDGTASANDGAAPVAIGALSDAVSALVNLGYARVDAHGAVLRAASSINGDPALKDLVKAGLKELGR